GDERDDGRDDTGPDPRSTHLSFHRGRSRPDSPSAARTGPTRSARNSTAALGIPAHGSVRPGPARSGPTVLAVVPDISDEEAMEQALGQAEAALAHGDVPVGAVVTMAGDVVAARHNERELRADP